MTEAALEKRFVKWCQDRDIVPIKGPSMIVRGIPDRYIQLPHGGGTLYIEFKGNTYYGLQPMQEWWKRYLTNADPLRYYLVSNLEELEQLYADIEKFIKVGPQVITYTKKLLEEL